MKPDAIFTGIEYHPSPNQDQRPDAKNICGIVIHNISLPPGEFGGGWIDDLFLNKLDPTAHPYFEKITDLRVSAHLLIRRDGEIIQYVPFYQRAWHAGVSQWDDRECCNDFTIGIEMEGCDEQNFESIQYDQLATIILSLCDYYPQLSTDRIKGHQNIAPGRKTDPGPYFDWELLTNLLKR
ncbi:MAG: 1,6-anhydro-N-acetylmuramyl-L-alanine amidase AmpD [Methylophaga sp.]|nr:1,6-anhydro-N-acetylmuramyl-L-alanine amidase AmpD [Methylophaga sp.]